MLAFSAICLFSLLLIGLGSLVAAPVPRAPGDGPVQTLYLLLAGWWAVSLVAVLCAIAGSTLWWLGPIAGVAGLGGLAWALARRDVQWLPLCFAWLALAPLTVLAAGLPPTLYDEFVQWLPNARYLVLHDAFPTTALPNVWSAAPSYPPALPLLGYLAGHFMPGGFEAVSKSFTILLGAATGLLLARPFLDRIPVRIAAPLGAAAATIASPFFDPRIALTSYADMPTAFVLTACVFAFWRTLRDDGSAWLFPAAATASLLVLLRETNLVLVVGLLAGLLLTGKRGRRPAFVLAIASGLTLALWRFYMFGAAVPPRLVPRALESWDWSAPAVLFRALLSERLINNPAAGLAATAFGLLAVCAIIAGWRRAEPAFKQLAVLAGALLVTWGCFLIWSYIAFFSPEEIAGAGSAWRYGAQIGPLLTLVLAEAAAPARRPHPIRREGTRRWFRLPVALAMLGLPGLVLWATLPHWRIDCRYPDIAAIRQIAQAVRGDVGETKLVVVHPVEASAYAVALDYTLLRPFGRSEPAAAPPDHDRLGSLMLDLRGIDRSTLQAGGDIPAVEVLDRTGPAWTVRVRIPGRRPNACQAGGGLSP